MDWQPIETAPKDGSIVVLAAFQSDDDRWRFWPDYWRKYLYSGEGFGTSSAIYGPASHWMPLPEPPQ